MRPVCVGKSMHCVFGYTDVVVQISFTWHVIECAKVHKQCECNVNAISIRMY